jgi:hypothetical protein
LRSGRAAYPLRAAADAVLLHARVKNDKPPLAGCPVHVQYLCAAAVSVVVGRNATPTLADIRFRRHRISGALKDWVIATAMHSTSWSCDAFRRIATVATEPRDGIGRSGRLASARAAAAAAVAGGADQRSLTFRSCRGPGTSRRRVAARCERQRVLNAVAERAAVGEQRQRS